MNKKILVVENKRWYRLEAAAQLEDAFPEHDIQTARGRTEVDELIDVGSIKSEFPGQIVWRDADAVHFSLWKL